jgi:hypothetical protein
MVTASHDKNIGSDSEFVDKTFRLVTLENLKK